MYDVKLNAKNKIGYILNGLLLNNVFYKFDRVSLIRGG